MQIVKLIIPPFLFTSLVMAIPAQHDKRLQPVSCQPVTDAIAKVRQDYEAQGAPVRNIEIHLLDGLVND